MTNKKQSNKQPPKAKTSKPFKIHKNYNYGCAFVGEHECDYSECAFFEKFKDLQIYMQDCTTDYTVNDCLDVTSAYIKELIEQAKLLKDFEAPAFFDAVMVQFNRQKMLDVGQVKLTPENYKSLSLTYLNCLLEIATDLEEEDNEQEEYERKYLVELINKYGIPEKLMPEAKKPKTNKK